MKIISVQRNREPEIKEIDGSIESMQQLVGGYIEAVYPFDDPVAIICNQEGKINGLPVSRFLYYRDSEFVDAICGTFFICGLGEEDLEDIPDNLAEKYIAMFMPDIVKI